ncbi:MAG: sensor histidine kinase [Kineosporiaceae bacterium]
MAADAVLAWRADAFAPQANPWRSLADVAVGLAFVAAAAAAGGPTAQRVLVGAVGVAWLAGSWLPGAFVLHQGVLIAALVAFPNGRPRGPVGWVCAALSVPVALGVLRQDGVAAVFALVAVVCLADRRRSPALRWYPGLAAAAAALVLGTIRVWSATRPASFDPAEASLAWQAALVAIASGFPAGSRQVLREHRELADRVLAAAAPSGLPGLAAVLAQTLNDPTLAIHPGPDTGISDEADGLASTPGPPGCRRLAVRDGTGTLAVLEHRIGALDDPATAEAVAGAVRLTATNAVLQREQREVLAELEASRVRLLAATDRVRRQVAQTLRAEVEAPVTAIADRLAAHGDELVTHVTDERDRATVAEALDVAASELGAVGREIQALVAGVPPAELGQGRLGAALASLTRGSPVPVTVRVDGEVSADAAAETALFYACSEALANAVKHAAASRVVIELRGVGESVEATVTDDGRGGADAAGSGLRGLADRLAASGGRLRVVSPPGAGTVLSAAVPR